MVAPVDELQKAPARAITLLAEMSFSAPATDWAGMQAPSSTSRSILSPLRPPASLNSFTASLAPLSTAAPSSATGPVIGTTAPILMVSAKLLQAASSIGRGVKSTFAWNDSFDMTDLLRESKLGLLHATGSNPYASFAPVMHGRAAAHLIGIPPYVHRRRRTWPKSPVSVPSPA